MKGRSKVTLAMIVGIPVAAALGQFIPREESGRVVESTVTPSGELKVRHISGKQYLSAYLDIVGVATACDGLTSYRGKPVKMGMRFTEAQCAAMLEEELINHAQGVMKCTPALALSHDSSVELRRQGPRFAAVSLAYNLGVSRYCSSTAKKRFNVGNYPGGCEALTWFNRAGGKVNKGLINRRKREYAVCTYGLGALK